MVKETKQGIFDELMHDWLGNESAEPYRKRWNQALPCKLPVIPEKVAVYIQKAKAGEWGLIDAFYHVGDSVSACGVSGIYDWERWIVENQDTFATAWLLEEWDVEEAEND